MTNKEILDKIKDDLKTGRVKVETRDTHRVYTDGTNEVLMEDTDTTLQNYYNTFINVTTTVKQGNPFDELERCTIFVGPPDTGKTYKACKYCEDNNIKYILIMGRDDLTLETLLEDFMLIDGKPAYKESLALQMLSGTEECVIIIDEFNTIRTGVMKTFQPILDTTSTTFEFKGKVYNKNLKCKFIFTLNDKDKGISILPDAILSRSKFVYFYPVNITTLSNWTGYKVEFIKLVQDLYAVLDMLPIFGTRQLNIVRNCPNTNALTEHLVGLLAMRNKESKLVTTPEVQSKLTKIIGAK